jgi:glycosyltransferase involved in cell wall biosynthesis
MSPTPTIVALWYEMTPYHARALERIQRELTEARMVHVFTHSVKNNSMPWEVPLPQGVEVVHDERNRVPNDAVIHRRFLGAYRSWCSVIERERPLFVLTSGHQDVSRWMLVPYLRRRVITYVLWSDSNVYGLNRGRPLKDALRRLYLRQILRGFDAFMPMGTCGRAYFRTLGPRGRPMFLRPYEPDYRLIQSRDGRAEQALAERHGLAPGRKRFLYSGRLIPVKRVDVLIRAFCAVADAMPEWDLLIAGGGPQEQALRSMVPERIRARITFTGFLQMQDVRCCYHLSHVLVHPSEFEPWALVINEAAAAGMAIVATDVTGAAVELVRDNVNGFLVSPGSQPELEAALAAFADQGLLERFRSASPGRLAEWRAAADPVDGLRKAVAHFARQRGQATSVAGLGM